MFLKIHAFRGIFQVKACDRVRFSEIVSCKRLVFHWTRLLIFSLNLSEHFKTVIFGKYSGSCFQNLLMAYPCSEYFSFFCFFVSLIIQEQNRFEILQSACPYNYVAVISKKFCEVLCGCNSFSDFTCTR